MLVILKIEIGGNNFTQFSTLKEFHSRDLSRIELDLPDDETITEDVGWSCILETYAIMSFNGQSSLRIKWPKKREALERKYENIMIYWFLIILIFSFSTTKILKCIFGAYQDFYTYFIPFLQKILWERIILAPGKFHFYLQLILFPRTRKTFYVRLTGYI